MIDAWWLVADCWLMIDDWCLMIDDWWSMIDDWWLMIDDWWLMIDDWWWMIDDWLLIIDYWLLIYSFDLFFNQKISFDLISPLTRLIWPQQSFLRLFLEISNNTVVVSQVTMGRQPEEEDDHSIKKQEKVINFPYSSASFLLIVKNKDYICVTCLVLYIVKVVSFPKQQQPAKWYSC